MSLWNVPVEFTQVGMIRKATMSTMILKVFLTGLPIAWDCNIGYGVVICVLLGLSLVLSNLIK